MTEQAVEQAVADARRFIERAVLVLANVRPYRCADGTEHRAIDGGKDSGALRRASMDLTRSLAIMRKP